MVELMPQWFREASPIWQALLAGLFTWGVTSLGAALVFFFRTMNQKFIDAMLGFAAGVMIAASVWSLILPGAELAEAQHKTPWLVAAIGVIVGAACLRGLDAVLPHLHLWRKKEDAEGLSVSWRRTTLLVSAITLHNIPEGLAVGFSFGAAASGELGEATGATFAAAVMLAIGIGLQNFPEGVSVSMPLRGEGMSRSKAFFYGQASGVVEPISAVIGAAMALALEPLLPYALCFAAGAMLFVVVEELIPESQSHCNTDIATLGAIGGFVVMMSLDMALG